MVFWNRLPTAVQPFTSAKKWSGISFRDDAGGADVGNWVELYIRRMLPFSIGGPALGTVR